MAELIVDSCWHFLNIADQLRTKVEMSVQAESENQLEQTLISCVFISKFRND